MRRNVWSLPLIVMALIMQVMLPLPSVRAEQENGLILVALPAEPGRRLAVRLQAYLDAHQTGYEVRRRSPAITDMATAQSAGQRPGALMVIWTDSVSSDHLNITPSVSSALLPAGSVAHSLRVDSADIRQTMGLVRLTAGIAASLHDACSTAQVSLDAAIDVAPQDWSGLGTAHYYSGVCQTIQERPLEALEAFERAAVRDNSWYVQHALAWTHFNLNEPRLALNAVTVAITMAPHEADLLLDRAYFYENQGNIAAAIEDYSSALILQPDNAEIFRRRGQAYFRAGSMPEALADFDNLVRLHPADPFALLSRSDVYLAMQRFGDAIADLDAGLAMDPAIRDQFLFQRGLAHLYMGSHADAARDLQDYSALRPEDAVGWINLGQAHDALGSTFSAIHDYETALALDSSATYLLTNLARLYYDASWRFATGSPEASDYLTLSVNAATQALRGFDQDTTALLYRALAAIELDQKELALEDLNAALGIDPSLEAALINRAIIYTELANNAQEVAEADRLYHAAVSDYASLLQQDFQSFSYLLQYQGMLFVELGEYDTALDHFDAYDELFPDAPSDPIFALYRGLAYLGLKRNNEALAALSVAVQDQPTDQYTCRAQLSSALILGQSGEDYLEASRLLQGYVHAPCTANPVLKATLQIFLTRWQSMSQMMQPSQPRI